MKWIWALIRLPVLLPVFLWEEWQLKKWKEQNMSPSNPMCKTCKARPVVQPRRYKYGMLTGLCEGCQDEVERRATIMEFIIVVE